MKPMTVGSLFAGIGGFDAGFEEVGFRTLWQVEKEPFCRAVLATHFPEAERFEDVRNVGSSNLRAVDVITAGVPCQDVSVAGKRAGLAGERTGLFYEFARILRELRPTWFVFENVPGLLSSNSGRDFAEVLRVLMVECGYGVQWRVLDSQFFGVAQRRDRLFVVGNFGKPCPAPVLFEPESSAGNTPKGGETWTDVAAPLTSGIGITGNAPGRRREDDINLAICLESGQANAGVGYDQCTNLTCLHEAPIVAATLNSGGNSGGFRTEPGEHIIAVRIAQTGANGIGVLSDGTVHTLDGTGGDAVCAPINPNGMRDFAELPEGLDSARYRALGNAVTTKVARWLATRIQAAEEGR